MATARGAGYAWEPSCNDVIYCAEDDIGRYSYRIGCVAWRENSQGYMTEGVVIGLTGQLAAFLVGEWVASNPTFRDGQLVNLFTYRQLTEPVIECVGDLCLVPVFDFKVLHFRWRDEGCIRVLSVDMADV